MDANTLVYLDFPQTIPTEDAFLVQGWIISRAEIQAVWLVAPEKLPLTLTERPDVSQTHTDFPFVKGFFAAVDKRVIQQDSLHLGYRLSHGEFNQIIMLEEPVGSISHRKEGYHFLKGHGLEIGALHQPAILPKYCTVKYCDVCTREEAIHHFPELNITDLVSVDFICDLDTQGLNPFSSAQFDFVIFNHVIEHVANPIKIVSELFRILKVQGHLIISAPDKDFTYDKNRALTPFQHLLGEYQASVTVVTDDHYLDFLRALHPHLFAPGKEASIEKKLKRVRDRREHAHVWDSESFSAFMHRTLALLRIEATCVFVHLGQQNKFEYFSVWQKRS